MTTRQRSTGKIGRPAVHFDNADRCRAYRERRQARVEDAEIALEKWERPTPGFVGFIAKRCVLQADHQLETAIAILTKAMEGIASAAGQDLAAAALNFMSTRKEHPDGVD